MLRSGRVAVASEDEIGPIFHCDASIACSPASSRSCSLWRPPFNSRYTSASNSASSSAPCLVRAEVSTPKSACTAHRDWRGTSGEHAPGNEHRIRRAFENSMSGKVEGIELMHLRISNRIRRVVNDQRVESPMNSRNERATVRFKQRLIGFRKAPDSPWMFCGLASACRARG